MQIEFWYRYAAILRGHDMKIFQCTRLRLCNYLMDREFFPYRVEPDPYHIYPAKDMKGNRYLTYLSPFRF